MPILGIMASSRPAFELVGSYDSLATVTLSASTASITFAGIPAGYKHLQIRGIARNTQSGTGAEAVKATFNSDTGSNYSRHRLYGNGTSAATAANSSTTFVAIGISAEGGETAGIFDALVCDILDYANTTKYKTIRALYGQDSNATGYQEVGLYSGLWMNTAAITRIDLSNSLGDFAQYSQLALYGIK